jgi:hypothetical protein
MKTELSWEKDVFSRAYTLFDNGKLSGYLKGELISQTANGVINGEAYSFKTIGVFEKNTVVYDLETYKSVAVITYDELRSKAILSIDNRVFYFKYNNLFQNKWQLSEAGGVHIEYASSLRRGCIRSTTEESMLLLSGILVADYYKRSQTNVIIYLMLFVIVLFAIVF